MHSPAQTAVALRMLARMLLRILWSTALVMAIVALAREWPAYQLQSKQAMAGVAKMPNVLESFAMTATFAASVLWLLVLDFVVIKWLVPTPRGGCPGCGYDLTALKSDRCPECGLEVGVGGTSKARN